MKEPLELKPGETVGGVVVTINVFLETSGHDCSRRDYNVWTFGEDSSQSGFDQLITKEVRYDQLEMVRILGRHFANIRTDLTGKDGEEIEDELVRVREFLKQEGLWLEE